MGQSRSKPHGSVPFGQTSFIDTSHPTKNSQQRTSKEKEEDEKEEEKDRLLALPHQYGLTNTNSSTTALGTVNTTTSSPSSSPPAPRPYYRPCTPPSPLTPLSFTFSTSPSSSSLSFSLLNSTQTIDHLDNHHCNYNNDEMALSHWTALINDVTYVDSTYYNKKVFVGDSDEANEDDDSDSDEHPLPPLPSFIVTEKTLTAKDIQSIDKTMHIISLTQQNLIRLCPTIGLFTMICKLDLTNNKLTSLPNTIGHLHRLETLYVANNQLETLPDTIGYLTKLLELDVSHNILTSLTPCLAHLKKLQILTASHNLLNDLPVHLVTGLKGLTILDLSHNAISILPAEITQLHFLRRLLLDGCPLVDPTHNSLPLSTVAAAATTTTTLATVVLPAVLPPATVQVSSSRTHLKPPCYSLLYSPPSLLELCARTIVRDVKKYQYYQQRLSQLPDHLVTYLYSAIPCTLCQGPYFDTYVARGRLVERSGRWIPVEYRLCCAHFTDESDRLLCMFSEEGASCVQPLDKKQSSLSPLSWYRPCLPPLTLLQQKNKRKSLSLPISISTPAPSALSSSASASSSSSTSSALTISSSTLPSAHHHLQQQHQQQQQQQHQHQRVTAIAGSSSGIAINNVTMMESVIQQHQQSLMQDETRMDPINTNGWRAHRMKVMNKNQSGFFSLTKMPCSNNDEPQLHQI